MAVSQEVFDAILAELTAGAAVRNILKRKKVNPRDFYAMLDADEDAAKRYARATVAGHDAMADITMQIADEKCSDAVAVQRNRLRVDTRKWWLAKREPKKYGDRTILAGDADNPLALEVSDAKASLLRGLTPKPTGSGEDETGGGAQ